MASEKPLCNANHPARSRSPAGSAPSESASASAGSAHRLELPCLILEQGRWNYSSFSGSAVTRISIILSRAILRLQRQSQLAEPGNDNTHRSVHQRQLCRRQALYTTTRAARELPAAVDEGPQSARFPQTAGRTCRAERTPAALRAPRCPAAPAKRARRRAIPMRSDQLDRAVGGAVVGDENLAGDCGALGKGTRLLHAGDDRLRLVEARHENGELDRGWFPGAGRRLSRPRGGKPECRIHTR